MGLTGKMFENDTKKCTEARRGSTPPNFQSHHQSPISDDWLPGRHSCTLLSILDAAEGPFESSFDFLHVFDGGVGTFLCSVDLGQSQVKSYTRLALRAPAFLHLSVPVRIATWLPYCLTYTFAASPSTFYICWTSTEMQVSCFFIVARSDLITSCG